MMPARHQYRDGRCGAARTRGPNNFHHARRLSARILGCNPVECHGLRRQLG
jgi:hypothetical protein